ncbi:UNVERIFIED_CONTAM: hypothetical protein GTU68_064666 [Idotea baltica]|nr:hypothetical protein [Idotea baltica]
MSSYHRLVEKYELVFVEGAGSPAEVNLRENDVANMGFAEEADCSVILVADIDRANANVKDLLKIKVPVFPRISNHTDFDALRAHPQADLEFVGQDGNLSSADLIILPGSKSVRADLAWLHKQGFAKQIQKHLRYGGKLLGVCGGFQMLGTAVNDPDGIEGPAGSSTGLGYLTMATEIRQEKRLENVQGYLRIGRKSQVSGYEIHCGMSSGESLNTPLMTLDNQIGNALNDGALSEDGQIAGTYLHGLFDHPDALVDLLNWAGLNNAEKIDRGQLRDKSLNRLAESIEQHFDWKKFEQATGIFYPGNKAQAV